eukprot:4378779-Ditylum_brightwellii.AAC.1
MAEIERSAEAKRKQGSKKTDVRKDWEAETRQINRSRLRHMVWDMGSNLFGVIVLEVWMLSEDRAQLV